MLNVRSTIRRFFQRRKGYKAWVSISRMDFLCFLVVEMGLGTKTCDPSAVRKRPRFYIKI